MCRWFQFVRVETAARHMLRYGIGALVLMIAAMGGMAARPQKAPIGAPPGAPANSIGQIEGDDISVEGGGASTTGVSNGTPRMFVSNGSIVTVHSGNARLTLFGGGRVNICGPAKLTMLESAGSLTLALNFGRVRVELPEKSALRIFTPTIVATPINIGGQARDVSVGLSLDDSLCVVAASGAMQLEHQFSGEKLIVPQDGSFFLAEGKLIPVAGARSSCQCAEFTPRIIPSMPANSLQMALNAPSPEVAALAAAITAAEAAAAPPPAPGSGSGAGSSTGSTSEPAVPEPNIEFSLPAHANEQHPVAAAPKDIAPAAPPVTVPVYTIVSPLSFSASAPVPPGDPTPDMALLIREAQVAPEWRLSGHVAAPEFAVALQQALGESRGPTTAQSKAATQTDRKPEERKRGFWAALKRAFSGS